MFGDTNGRSSNSPFGSPSVFGLNNNANNNPLAQKPFGSPSPFGAQTASSIFGGTSTGVYRSSPAFGETSTPAFGSSMPAFGASSSPAFGGTSTQSSPFKGSFHQSQPTLSSSVFGSSPLEASSQPTFCAPSTTPAFGSSSTPAFGASFDQKNSLLGDDYPRLDKNNRGNVEKRVTKFRYVEADEGLDDGIDVSIPLESVQEATTRYNNTLYGYFIGKRVAFPVVQSYVTNVWNKYGLQKTMMNANGFFFFKFESEKGMQDVLENGPWMIRKTPIILNKWSPDISLTKEDLTKVPVWVKLRDIPLAGFTEDGLSAIFSRIGKPIMLDSFTSSMCLESWGRPNYARAMVEVSAEVEFKDILRVATPSLNGLTKSNIDVVTIDYEWKPPRCSFCKVFGHKDAQCPRNIPIAEDVMVVGSDESQTVVTKNRQNSPFGSQSAFGQSSNNSPFGFPSVFGQNNNANNNPFVQKPFGSPSLFGAKTGGSIFGVFGSSPAFGAISTPAFGNSMPSSSPAIGAIVAEHGADIEALMPKLRHYDYYTEPRITELAAKERAEPGFCSRVKDFVVGHYDYGSIKFLWETDVRGLDLESLIQFNNREVIVYLDETKKPPPGQGFNKPAEVTLLNIKCFDKNKWQYFTKGSRVKKFEERLKKKTKDLGAEFVSYDPVKGEWKFRVIQFSRHRFQDDDEDYPA